MSLIANIQRDQLRSLEAAQLQAESARNIIEANKLHDYSGNVRVAHDQLLSAIALLAAQCRLIEYRLRDGD